jgi:nickel-type superoxide dismutase maturation protease
VRWPPLIRVTVAERSMEPALRPGDWLLVRRTRRVRPGQIVLARHPGRPDMLIVKRAARRVDGGWWLESDNPEAGAVDSRRFGPVPAVLVEGRVLVRYWRRRTLIFRPNERWCAHRAHENPVAPPGGRTTGLASRPGTQCRGPSGMSAIRSLCSATSRSMSSRGSEVATAQ